MSQFKKRSPRIENPQAGLLAAAAGVVALSLLVSIGCGPSANGSGEQNGEPSTNVTEPSTSVTEPDSAEQGGVEQGGVEKGSVEQGGGEPGDGGASSKSGDSEKTTGDSGKGQPKTAAAPGALKEITFEDINLRIQADVVFRPWMLKDEVKSLDGQRVRIAGYMMPGAEIEGVKEFVLLRNTECKFGPGGQADHLIMVTMKSRETTSYRTKPISVEGILKINPFQGTDGNTWSIYDLVEAENVESQSR